MSRTTPLNRRSRANLPSFKEFLLVCEVSSFREIAKLTEFEPSVVSRSVRSLEDEIGVILFRRRSRGAEPISAAQAIFPRVRGIVDELRMICSKARDSGQGAQGTFKMEIVSSVAAGKPGTF
jgi:DNA-binding transcriptional LysR family regulator